VAEGIETALSAALGFGLVWAAIDAGNLAAFPLLEGVESLTIVADHDPPHRLTGRSVGLESANICARRWRAGGTRPGSPAYPGLGYSIELTRRASYPTWDASLSLMQLVELIKPCLSRKIKPFSTYE
jgi:hypothetical protein